MKMFAPYAIINIRETNSEIRGNYKRFPTYDKLKKSMKSLLQESEDNEVHVLRSRRGEWGEWNEIWNLNHSGKPIKIKEHCS
jgi:hypothetical protein